VASLTVLVALTLQVLPQVSSTALADCDLLIDIVRHPREARGTTFEGTVMWVADQPAEHSVTFRVHDVYAGQVPDQLTLDSTSCHPLAGFRAGGRYLVSTGGDAHAESGDTLAWELSGGRAQLLGFDAEPEEYPSRFRRADTLAWALDIVAPGAERRRPARPEPVKESPIIVDALIRRACTPTSGGCIRLLDLHSLADDSHWGTEVLMSPDGRPVPLVTGLPGSLPPGTYEVSASEWLVIPGDTLQLLGQPAGCTTTFEVRPGDAGTRVSLGFSDGACGFSIVRVPVERPASSPDT